jgi:N-glycosylase/DNA lyase
MTLARATLAVENYDLAATLGCGQAFRWRRAGPAWEGVVGSRWVRLRQERVGLCAETAGPVSDWQWLRDYLQTEVDLRQILATFPDDPPMRRSVEACRGLRLLRQEPWECLASFICSSTKRIVQIEQIVALLCRRFGQPLAVPAGTEPAWSFPSVERLAAATEAELRQCKLGFRAPYLSATARKLAAGEAVLGRLPEMPLEEARAALLALPGVGVKIADCVLLFACGFQEAFPVDVWIIKALRELYFPGRRPKLPRLRHFSRTHFGPHGGYAQQYLFHYMRTQRPPSKAGAIDHPG